MNNLVHLLYLMYFIFTILDLVKASRDYTKYTNHVFMTFHKPTKTWFHFFIKKYMAGQFVHLPFSG